MFRIYVLVDPTTNAVRYVGITALSLQKRLREHIRDGYNDNSNKSRWIRTLLYRGLKPKIWLMEETNDAGREAYWIAKLRAEGWLLTNAAPGGTHAWTRKKRKRRT